MELEDLLGGDMGGDEETGSIKLMTPLMSPGSASQGKGPEPGLDIGEGEEDGADGWGW